MRAQQLEREAERLEAEIPGEIRKRAPVPPLEGRWKGGFVVMEQTTGRWPRARRVADELVAEAVDAADDLAGDPRLVLDLNDPEGRAKLGL